MRDAVKDGDTLVAPSVGTWRSAVGPGHPISPGLTLGHLRRAGRDLEVRAPAGSGGVVSQLAPSGRWLAYGDTLCVCVQGLGGESTLPIVVEIADGPEGCVPVCSDTDGTVYLSPDPASPPFAVVGQRVAQRATVALVEVMKTFSPVRVPVAGEVVRIDVAHGAAVEEGDALVWLRPD